MKRRGLRKLLASKTLAAMSKTGLTSKVITADEAMAAFSYDPETGVIRRLDNGAVAGGANGEGYVVIGHKGRRYYAHRIAFLLMTGEWPAREVDHIDGVQGNNVWTNLREVSRLINSQNMRRAKGYSVCARTGKFLSRIVDQGKLIRLGIYETPEFAHGAYLAAKRRMHAGNTL